MRSKITVIGAPGLMEELVEGDYADVVDAESLPGSDVVVIGPDADVVSEARRASSRASGAVLIVVDNDVEAAVRSSLFPRGRVLGAPASRVREVAQAVLFDRCGALDVTILGLDDRVGEVRAIVGAGGVRELQSGDSRT